MQVKQLIKFSIIFPLILLSGCYLKSSQTKTDEATVEQIIEKPSDETVTPKPVKPKPVKPKPVKPEPVKPAPVKPEPVKPEPVKPDAVKPDAVKPDAVKPDAVKPDAVKPDAVKPEPVKPQVKTVLTLSGQITLDQSRLDEQNAKVEKTIVYFEPQYTKTTPLPQTNANIVTQNKQFEPNVLAITAGSEVSFPNMDRILHNVFSVSPESEFDLGLYSAGTSKTVTFDEAGVIYVHCNVHHSMQADILVLDTPYFTQVDEQGNFTLKDLPELTGTLKTWHPRGQIESQQLTTQTNTQKITQSVVISRPEVPKHRNKFGKSYRRVRY